MNSFKSTSTRDIPPETKRSVRAKTEASEPTKRFANQKSLRAEYKKQYESFHKAKQQKLQQRMMRLQFIIKNASELNSIIEEMKQ